MALPQLDPLFEEYVREHPTISYAQPDDPWLVKHFI
jgi:competence transcription factor ComK